MGDAKIGETIVAVWVPDSQGEVGTFKRTEKYSRIEDGAAGVALRQGHIAGYIINSPLIHHLFYSYTKTNQMQLKLKLRGLSPHANYTDRAAAAGRRS